MPDIRYKIINEIEKEDLLTREKNIIIFVEPLGKCKNCIWCYDNGTENICNDPFECINEDGFIDKRIYYLDDNLEPRRINDNKTWVKCKNDRN